MNKRMTRGAVLIAVAVVLQSLRLVLPLPPMINMFLIGALVNMMLVVIVRSAGMLPAVAAAIILPILAYMQGQLPLLILVPLVMGGNSVYVYIADLLWHKGTMLAPFAKTFCMFVGCMVVFKVFQVEDSLIFTIGTMFGWPQIVTGVAGIIFARTLLKELPYLK